MTTDGLCYECSVPRSRFGVADTLSLSKPIDPRLLFTEVDRLLRERPIEG